MTSLLHHHLKLVHLTCPVYLFYGTHTFVPQSFYEVQLYKIITFYSPSLYYYSTLRHSMILYKSSSQTVTILIKIIIINVSYNKLMYNTKSVTRFKKRTKLGIVCSIIHVNNRCKMSFSCFLTLYTGSRYYVHHCERTNFSFYIK